MLYEKLEVGSGLQALINNEVLARHLDNTTISILLGSAILFQLEAAVDG